MMIMLVFTKTYIDELSRNSLTVISDCGYRTFLFFCFGKLGKNCESKHFLTIINA